MKALGLAAFSLYFAFLTWLWLRDLRRGEINRFPVAERVYKASQPRRFATWTVIHTVIWSVLFGLLMLAWWALFTGNLH